MGLSGAAESTLVGLLVFAAAVWIGGFVSLIIVARVTSRILASSDRVAFFRTLGRFYGIVAGSALVLGLVTGAILLFAQQWTMLSTVIVVVASGIVVTTLLGVAQARGMTRLRRRALAAQDDPQLVQRIRRGARSARVLRALLGMLSLALLALGAAHGG